MTDALLGGDARFGAIVIGAGFGGMYALHRLREAGLTVCGIEAGGDVGGTWYWNRYPGARCDVMSIDYSYAFSDEIQQAWTWSERFAAGSEIRAYANFVAARLDLRRDVRFESRVERMRFDDARNVWIVHTSRGEVIQASFCIMATGPLSVPKPIDIPGAEQFAGEIYQSGRWPHHEVSFAGKRVGVVGTGSSGIQIVPVVAETAQTLHVFQRTPSFTLPMRNVKLGDDYVAQIKRHYRELRAVARNTFTGGVRAISTRPLFSIPAAERQALMQDAWRRGGIEFLGLFSDLLVNQEANDIVADFVRAKIDEVVEDKATAEALKPRGYPIFARRPCLDTNYYETFNRPNVTLVDCLTDPIEAISVKGLKTRTRDIALDLIIMATGYDALTGAMLAIDITGRDGRRLRDAWREGARSYLALAVAGFPNMFVIGGPNGPSALANYIALDEMNVDWAVSCIGHMRAHGLAAVEATAKAEAEWVTTVSALADHTLYPKANTWYVGANIPGKPRVFSVYAGGLNRYREACEAAAAANYSGFVFTPAPASGP